jgi:hypothetical protein
MRKLLIILIATASIGNSAVAMDNSQGERVATMAGATATVPGYKTAKGPRPTITEVAAIKRRPHMGCLITRRGARLAARSTATADKSEHA